MVHWSSKHNASIRGKETDALWCMVWFPGGFGWEQCKLRWGRVSIMDRARGMGMHAGVCVCAAVYMSTMPSRSEM